MVVVVHRRGNHLEPLPVVVELETGSSVGRVACLLVEGRVDLLEAGKEDRWEVSEACRLALVGKVEVEDHDRRVLQRCNVSINEQERAKIRKTE